MNNLEQFVSTVKKAYSQQRCSLPENDLNIYDKLIECPAVVTHKGQGGWVGRPIQVHRQWRRRVAQAYAKSEGRPLLGVFGFDLDWEAIWTWILENIVPILKMLLVIVPFII